MNATEQQAQVGPPITQLAFDDADFTQAKALARTLGYGDNTAYTSSSAMWGLFCLRRTPDQAEGCIIKTKEFGLMFVQTLNDLNIES